MNIWITNQRGITNRVRSYFVKIQYSNQKIGAQNNYKRIMRTIVYDDKGMQLIVLRSSDTHSKELFVHYVIAYR